LIPSAADCEIEAHIAAVDRVRDLPLNDPGPPVDAGLIDAYVDATVGLSLAADREVQVAYTPLHGVGRDTLLSVFRGAGTVAPIVESAQADPDPDVPTVSFPNPEEPGVINRVMELGRQTRADVVIANDPDADRCAVAVGGRRLAATSSGSCWPTTF